MAKLQTALGMRIAGKTGLANGKMPGSNPAGVVKAKIAPGYHVVTDPVTGRKTLSQAFTPFVQPDRPPPGYYDPSIDATVGASDRGYGDLGIDVGTQAKPGTLRVQGLEDVAINKDAVNRAAGRSLADLVQARQRGATDFASTTAERQRQYQNLGQSQAGAAQMAGVQSGGTLAAALEARNANQGREQGAAQQSFDRFNQDNTTAQTRTGEDQATAIGGIDLQANRTFGVGGTMDTQYARAGRENANLHVDASGQAAFQAGQLGWHAPAPPTNEFRSPGGIAYRVLKGKTRNQYLLANGTKSATRPA